jgi:uncharacterized protein (UPF0333 family)
MKGGALSARGAVLLAAMLAGLFVAGCGGSGGSTITVQTGSLSKTAFIEKADAICKAARTEFLAKYENLLKEHKAELFSKNTTKETQEAVIGEVIDSVLTPNMEGEIARIGELGAPKSYAPEATAFLGALQTKLEEVQGDHSALSGTQFPFKKAEDIARRAGMYGCAESFG